MSEPVFLASPWLIMASRTILHAVTLYVGSKSAKRDAHQASESGQNGHESRRTVGGSTSL